MTMWLVNNQRAGNPHPLSGDILQGGALYRPSRRVSSDRWIVIMSYGGAALFGLVFWIALAWMFL
jgi:hypothetical protein